MRSLFRVLTVTGLAAVAAGALDAQARRPVRPLPPEARERQLELRERMLERREAMLERREGRGPRGAELRGGAGPRGGRMGMRAPGGGRPGAGLREGGPGRGMERRMMIRRGVMRERIANLKPEQREALRKHRESFGAERSKIREEVQAGRLNREQARARIQKWREEHKPPVDLRRPVRPNGE